MDFSKLIKEGEKLGLSESAVYLLKKFQADIDELNANLSRLQQHFCISCNCYITAGGAITEEISASGVKPGMHALVQMKQSGASPVSIVSAKCEMGKIIVTFSDDPADDHELTYHVCR